MILPPWKYAGYYGDQSWSKGQIHRYSSRSGSSLKSTSLSARFQHSWTNGRVASGSYASYVWNFDDRSITEL